jgi:RNA recognition motif-containing protein
MREKGRAEKERDDSRRSRSRVSPSNRRPHGYIHNVDQASVSYFVTNFPEDCTSEDLWKLFARFGRVGDVFIPSKLDKRGKRFAFVKYMEAKEMEELRRNMEDLWLGTFKLRINKSRFDRRDDGGKREEPVQRLGRAFGESNVHPDRSFKTALVH